jgi:hypothetical protein
MSQTLKKRLAGSRRGVARLIANGGRRKSEYDLNIEFGDSTQEARSLREPDTSDHDASAHLRATKKFKRQSALEVAPAAFRSR